MRLDLHGMRTRDAIDRFIYEYNRTVGAGGERMEVVHGYGSSGVGGDIKGALCALLDAHASKVRYIKGESLGNKGITVVIPDGALPSRQYALDPVVGSALSIKPVSVAAIEQKLSGLATADEIQRSLAALVSNGKAIKVIQTGRLLYAKK